VSVLQGKDKCRAEVSKPEIQKPRTEIESPIPGTQKPRNQKYGTTIQNAMCSKLPGIEESKSGDK
jgi:hypothetical protein